MTSSKLTSNASPVEECAARLCALLWSLRRADRAELSTLEGELVDALRAAEPSSHDHGALEALLAVTAAAVRRPSRSPLGARTDMFEPGSLPERLLLEISQGTQGAHADLAERLGTDAWQLSRAGRRLRVLGLAERTRSGRVDSWALTPDGEREARRHR